MAGMATGEDMLQMSTDPHLHSVSMELHSTYGPHAGKTFVVSSQQSGEDMLQMYTDPISTLFRWNYIGGKRFS